MNNMEEISKKYKIDYYKDKMIKFNMKYHKEMNVN